MIRRRAAAVTVDIGLRAGDAGPVQIVKITHRLGIKPDDVATKCAQRRAGELWAALRVGRGTRHMQGYLLYCLTWIGIAYGGITNGRIFGSYVGPLKKTPVWDKAR